MAKRVPTRDKETNKKIGSKKFKQLLHRYSSLSMEDQKKELDNFFEKWKGDYEQVDDVCVIGIRV